MGDPVPYTTPGQIEKDQTVMPNIQLSPTPMYYKTSTGMSTGAKIVTGIVVVISIAFIVILILAATGQFNTKITEDKKTAVAPPAVARPVVTSPVVTSPVVTSPVVTPPVVTPPAVASPVVTPPVVTPPVVTPPVVTPPVVAPPVVAPPVNNITPTPPGTTGYTVPEGVNYVLGYSGGSFDDFTEQGQTPESCIKKASENKDKYNAWGYRTPVHPESKLRNTCFLYKKPFLPYLGDSKDTAHVTGCLNPNEKVEWGCATSKPSNILAAGIKWVRGFINSPIDDTREQGQTEESCRLKALENKDKYSAWGFRTKEHPDEKLRNTCLFYKKPFPMFAGNMTDINHVTGCLNPDERVEWGCSTTAPTSSVFMPKKQPIKSKQNNECIDVYQASTNNEVGVDTYGCTDNDNQKWTYDSKNRLIAAHSGKCLTVTGGQDARPVQRDCTDGNGQKWSYEPSTQRIISVDNGLCLDRPGNGRITMWECHDGDNQKWYL